MLDELARVADLLGTVADLEDRREFAPVVLEKLAAIVPGDVLNYNEIDLVAATVNCTTYPGDALDPSTGLVLAAYAHEHPFIRHIQRTGDETPCRISDLVTRKEFHSLGLYNELLRPAGLHYQIALSLRDPARVVVGIAVNRSRHDFTDRERDVLTLLRPPLAASYRRLTARGQPRSLRRSADVDVLTDRERQVLELVAAGRTDRAIGRLLGCSGRTIGKHLQHAYRKLGVTNRIAAIVQLGIPIGGSAPGRTAQG